MYPGKKKVVLFYPKTDAGNIVRFMPLALLKLGSQLRGAGYDVITIDERFDKDYAGRLAGHLDGALFFGVSVMTGYQIRGALQASAAVKKIKNDLPIVWGGWHPSILPEETLKNEHIDIAVRGQGEETVVHLARALESKENLSGIEGISYKEKNKISSNNPRSFQDINQFYPLKPDILDMERYITPSPLGTRTIFWNSSQGCPYRCGFCCTPAVYKRMWSGLKASTLVKQLELLVKDFKINTVIFAEDNFLVDIKRVEELMRELIEKRLSIKWATDVRIDKVNQFSDEFLTLFKKSGCAKFFVGAESGDPDILNLIDKKIRVEDTRKMAAKLAHHKIISEFFLIVGFPQNPERDLKATLDLIKDLKSRYPDHEFTVVLFTPYPGTPLMELAVKKGLRVPKKLEEWVNWNVLSVNTPWVDKKYLNKSNMFAKYLYPLAFPSSALKEKFKRRGKGLPYRVLHRIASFRVSREFFALPVEWELLKWFHSLKTRFGWFRNVESFR